MRFRFSSACYAYAVAFGLTALTCNLGYADDESPATEEKAAVEKKEAHDPVAVHGTPKIDGEIEEAWNSAPEFSVDKPVSSETTIPTDKLAKAKVRLMWDETHVYALFQVTDPKLSDQSFDDYQQDTIEFFIDELNEKSGSYQEDDAQYRISFKGKKSGGDNANLDNVEAKTKEVDGGYIVELAVKLNKLKPEAGKEVGIELQVNDDSGSGSRGGITKWHHAENDSYLSTSNFGTVKLVDKAE